MWEGYKNYDHYFYGVNPDTIEKWYKEAAGSGFKSIGVKQRYWNIPASFDIETSSYKSWGKKYATMYVWSFCLNGSTIIGRTWGDFRQVLKYLEMHMNTRKVGLIIYVHNLAYEFQWMRKWFAWDEVFAVKDRRPIHATMPNGIEFKCSYILSNYALAYIGAKLLLRYPVQKAVGDLDYSLVRHSDTGLTPTELWYSVRDVQVVTSYIQEKIENEGGIQNIPLTNTGYVRQYCRNYCFTQFEDDPKYRRKLSARYHERMRSLSIMSECEYDQLKAAFAGGFTHAAPMWSGKLVESVCSFDLASSYPAVMVMKKFPMSRGTFVGNATKEEVEYLISEGYCVLFTVRLYGVNPKFLYENYISASRCTYLSPEAVINNGRVASAECLQVTVTEQDWDIIQHCYSWDDNKTEYFGVRYYAADYLPTPFILSILHLFGKKTSLKGVEGKETEYMVSKNMINSAYGMSVTDIVRKIYEYSDTSRWIKSDADVDEQLTNYNNSYNRFLFYAWGVWVTAHARHNLWKAIFEFGEDFVYADTDSIKGLNYEKHAAFFTRYNFSIKAQIIKASHSLGIPKELYTPKTKNGVEKMIGVFEREDDYKKFKTIGAKRYIYEYESGELLFTVSGVNKYYGTPYLLETYSNPNYSDLYKQAYSHDPSKEKEAKEAMKKLIELHNSGEVNYDEIFNVFSEGLYFPPEATGKQTLTYIDTMSAFDCTDYTGKTKHCIELSSIHMEPQYYYMSQTDEYIRFLRGFRDGSI